MPPPSTRTSGWVTRQLSSAKAASKASRVAAISASPCAVERNMRLVGRGRQVDAAVEQLVEDAREARAVGGVDVLQPATGPAVKKRPSMEPWRSTRQGMPWRRPASSIPACRRAPVGSRAS